MSPRPRRNDAAAGADGAPAARTKKMTKRRKAATGGSQDPEDEEDEQQRGSLAVTLAAVVVGVVAVLGGIYVAFLRQPPPVPPRELGDERLAGLACCADLPAGDNVLQLGRSTNPHSSSSAATLVAPAAAAAAGTAAGHSNDGVLGLDMLLRPLTPTAFYEQHWEHAPVHVSRPPAYFTGLLPDLADIPLLLATQAAVQGAAVLANPQTNASQADCIFVKQGMSSRVYDSNHLAYLDGATIVCHLVAASWPPLAELMAALERDTGLPYMANMYLSPRGTQGFSMHTDNKDGFIAHTAGAKRWIMHNSSFPLPMRKHMVGRNHERPTAAVVREPVFDQVVSAGDVLYVPRGILHQAQSLDHSPALHFTLSPVKNLEWCTLLETLVAYTEREDQDPRVVAFLDKTIRSAVAAEQDEPSSAFIRAAVPRFYTDKARRDDFEAAIDAKLEEFQAVMTERLLEQFRARPEGIEVMRQAFAVLGNRTARSGAVERALNQNQVYVDYVHSLIEHARNEGAAARNSLLALPASQGTQHMLFAPRTRFRFTRSDVKHRVDPDHVHLVWGRANSIRLRNTPTMKLVVRFLAERSRQGEGLTTFVPGELPTNDIFEAYCVVRVMLDRELAVRLVD